jgi:N-acetylmuramoyl-L-alanine amidase
MARSTKRTGRSGGIGRKASSGKHRSRGRTSKKYKQQLRRKRMIAAMMVILVIVAGATIGSHLKVVDISHIDYPSYVDQQFIKKDGHSRTGNKIRRVNDIVIHYVGNEGSTAQANRDYFDSYKSTVSSHFVVGLQGEVIQCVPLDEWSSASNNRNKDTISIEVCHPTENGKFNDVTYARVVELTAWLCDEFGLDEKDVIRHHDVTGKLCPLYYVEHEDAWEQMRKDIKKAIKKL